jgi:hypothetical protein
MYFNIGSKKEKTQWHDVWLSIFFGSFEKLQNLKSFTIDWWSQVILNN